MRRIWESFWQQRSAADRRIILAVTAIALGGLFYAYVWLPISQERARLRAMLPELRGVAAQMALQAAEAARLKALLASAGRGRGARATVEQVARTSGIAQYIKQLTVVGENRVQVSLDSVAFDDWIGFLKSVLAQPYVRLDSNRIAATGNPGLVQVQAVISVSEPKASTNTQ